VTVTVDENQECIGESECNSLSNVFVMKGFNNRLEKEEEVHHKGHSAILNCTNWDTFRLNTAISLHSLWPPDCFLLLCVSSMDPNRSPVLSSPCDGATA